MIDARDGKAEERNVFQERFVFVMHRLDRTEIVEMLGIDVRDDTDLGRQPRERAVALVGFDDHPLALTKPRVRAPRVDDAAGYDRRFFASFRKNVREQRRRCCLAVRAGDGNRRIKPHQFGEHLGAPYDRQTLLARSDQLRIERLHRRRNHDIARPDQIDRIVPEENPDALRP